MSNALAEKPFDSAEVLSWLVMKLADWLEVAPAELDAHRPISSYGLDSISGVTLAVQLEEELGIELDSAVLWNHPTIGSLAEHLTEALSSACVTRLSAGGRETLQT